MICPKKNFNQCKFPLPLFKVRLSAYYLLDDIKRALCSFRPFKKVLACFMLKGRVSSPQVTPLLGPALRVDTFPSPGGFSNFLIDLNNPTGGHWQMGNLFLFLFVCFVCCRFIKREGISFLSYLDF